MSFNLFLGIVGNFFCTVFGDVLIFGCLGIHIPVVVILLRMCGYQIEH